MSESQEDHEYERGIEVRTTVGSFSDRVYHTQYECVSYPEPGHAIKVSENEREVYDFRQCKRCQEIEEQQ